MRAVASQGSLVPICITALEDSSFLYKVIILIIFASPRFATDATHAIRSLRSMVFAFHAIRLLPLLVLAFHVLSPSPLPSHHQAKAVADTVQWLPIQLTNSWLKSSLLTVGLLQQV